MPEARNRGKSLPRSADLIIPPTERQDRSAPRRPRKRLGPPKRVGWLGYITLILLTIGAYVPILQSDMLWSNFDEVERSAFTSMEHWTDAWHPSAIRAHNPFELSSYFLETWIPLPAAPVHHAINILLHLVAALLLLKTLEALKLPGAFAASLVFALHPSVVSVVFWSGYRGELIGLIFLLAALFFGVSKKKTGHFGLLLVFSVLAFVVHPGTLVLPLVLGLCIFTKETSIRLKDYNRLLPLFCFALFIGIWTQGAHQETSGESGPLLSLAAQNLFFYLKQTLFPLKLALFHPFPEGDPYSVGAQYSFLPFLIFLPFYVLIAVNYRKPWVRGALLGITGYLLLVIYGLVQTGAFLDGTAAQENHLQYLALPVLLSSVICTLAALARNMGRHTKYIWNFSFTIFASLSLTMTASFALKLSDRAVIWQSMIQQWPDSWQPKLAFIETVRERGEDSALISEQAMIEMLSSVLEQQPDRIEERQILARIYRDLEENSNALREYKRILRDAEPDDQFLEEAATFYDQLGLSWEARNARERISN